MRKRLLVMFAAVAALALVGSQTFAIPLEGQLEAGPFVVHLRDASSLYVEQDAGPSVPRAPLDIDGTPGGDPTPAGWEDTTVQLGDEQRTVIHIDQWLFEDSGNDYVPPLGQLTALLYDVKVSAIVGTGLPGSITTVFFDELGRNPVEGRPAGTGGVVEVWYDPTPEGEGVTLFDPSSDGLAPFKWVEEGGPAGNGHAVAPDAYPTVNLGDDAILWLQAVLVPQDMAGTLSIEVINLLGLQPNGATLETLLHITGGAAASLFQRDVFGPGIDLRFAATLTLPGNSAFDGTPQDIGNWSIRSFDPVEGQLIPEPATLSLLGMGCVGLGLRLRRRRK